MNGPTAKAKWILSAVDLWHNFTKKKKKESKDDRDAQKLQPRLLEGNQLSENIIAKHDDHHVHKVVGY